MLNIFVAPAAAPPVAAAPPPPAAPAPRPAPAAAPVPALAPAAAPAAAPTDRVYASPFARRIAELKNLRLGGKPSLLTNLVIHMYINFIIYPNKFMYLI